MGQALLEELRKGSTKSTMVKRRIITYLICNGKATITDLAKDMDLSVPTVTKFVDEMIEDGYVLDNGKLETSGGRYPNLYGLCADAAYFLGVEVARDFYSIGVSDFQGNMLHQILRVSFQRENTLACVDSLCKAINEFIDGHKLDRSKIMNVCVSLAGRVNSETGFSYSFFKFGDTSLRDLLIERIGLPVEVENDSRVMAYGEYMRGDFKDVKNLIYINAGWGLGMAIIIDGKLYRGMSGFSGEFGHNYGYDNQQICHCGKKGCIETEVSCSALYRKFIERLKNGENSILLREKKIEEIEISDILSAINREDVLGIELVEEIGGELGRHIGCLINIFNPELVVIGGDLSKAGGYLLHPVIAAIRKYTLNLMYRDSDILLAKLQDDANVVGTCLLGRTNLFAV